MRRAHQIWVVLGVSMAIILCTNLTSRLSQRPRVQTSVRSHGPLRSNVTTLTDGLLTFHLNQSTYDADYPQLQRYRCREVISRDDVCRGSSGGLLLLLAVKSHPASGSRRATLRRTWARPREMGGFQLRPMFLMAEASNHRHAQLVQLENSTFGDILMWDFVESHHNLSLKERCFLQWVHEHCRQAAYVFKGDDDLFVNPKALTEYLNQTPNASDFIHGNIQHHAAVMRHGKYAVSPTFYPMDRYPNFASGGGFIMPRSPLAALYDASLRLPVFPLDDVYLGFLALAAGLSHQHDERFRVWGVKKDELKAYQEALTVHGASMERIEQVWAELWGLHGGEA